ncbi:unnamed protein product [Adineta steineri]|uniref:Transcription factor BYE1 n=1 Tax=Adineta steineri TaxID=433720 RepID=A0A814C2D3_9BILA|nr:unnamed protein product [Adineta steineri]
MRISPPDDNRIVDESSIKETNSSSYLQDDEDDPFTFRSRKSYPQRVNRPKLNYRDLDRGMYDAHELRQSLWALGGPGALNKTSPVSKNNTNYSDDEDEEDMTVDDETDDILNEQKNKSNDDIDQKHRRLWCICKKPWDHSRLMLRCDSCANWYHGDCIGVTKEQARVLDMNGDQFVCPPCQVITVSPGMKPGRSSDESILIKRKRIDAVSPSDRKVNERNGNLASIKHLTHSEPSKRPKTGIFFQRDSSTEPQIHCIVHGCSNWAKSGWVYCSSACIRRHINDTLQAIQRSKGADNENPPSREDILLYENRTKKVLDRKLVPKVEDLCTWINHNPSYEIVKPALKQSILLTANESKSSLQPGLVRSSSIIAPKTPTTPNSTKPKLSWAPVAPNTKPIPIKKAPVQVGRQTSNTSASSTVQNYADIRMKVPQALYDKLIARLEKSGEKLISNDDMRILVDKIEEEMYRVYGKVDNSYKNKFRSLLANISNMNNSFFYKHILSKEVTAKQIVAMKPEDMLPPEEKEKRKDEFEKEVQMIMKAEEQSAEEMARRARTKNTRQGIVDNDPVLPMFKNNEQKVIEEKNSERDESKSIETSKTTTEVKKNTNSKPIIKSKKPITSTTGQKSSTINSKPKVQTTIFKTDTTSSHGKHTFDINCSICTNSTAPKIASPKASTSIPTGKLQIPEIIPQPTESLPIKSSDDLPNLPVISPPPRVEPNEVSNATFQPVDLDNDYIEPESPTGIDALIYDDDEDLKEKEKRKDEFEKEVQMIMKAEEQSAEEMARRARTKNTRQGIVDNDPVLPMFKNNEQKVIEEKNPERNESKSIETSKTTTEVKKNTNSKPIIKSKKPITSTTGQKPSTINSKPKVQTTISKTDTTSSHGKHTFDINCSICTNSTTPKIASPKASTSIPTGKLQIPEIIPQPTESLPIKSSDDLPNLPVISPPPRVESNEVSNATFQPVDLDNDYIEPESPTGIDALIYDDDDDLNNMHSHSRHATTLQHVDSPGDNNDYFPPVQTSVRDDYNPLAASKPKTDTPSMYQPTPIARSSSIPNQWRGIILTPDAKIPCQSLRIYGEGEYLIGDIPEQLGILGRLRLGDLWEYIRDSIAVRDVIILTLTPLNNNDNNAFLRYVETMRTSGRAAVINKRTEPSIIRDMYVLPADLKDCSSNVISTFSLSTNIDPKQLFLIVVGSGKKSTKSLNRPNESHSSSNLTYKPVSLQDSTAIRDPRLLRNKDPRLTGQNGPEITTNDNTISSIPQIPNTNSTKSISNQKSTEDLFKLTSESFERIRHSKSADAIHSIVMSTLEILKSNGREDLCTKFTNDLHTKMSEWQKLKETNSNRPVTAEDNLNEENMEVDDEQDDKLKRQLSESEYNDVDYRFLGQDTDHRMTTSSIPENEQSKDVTTKSPFSDVFSAHRDADDRSMKSNLTKEERDKKNNDY